MKNFPSLIVLLDDHPIASEGFANICEKAEWNCEVKAFTSKEPFFRFLQSAEPDMLLIDIQLDIEDGRDIIKELKERKIGGKIIALSSFDDPIVIRSAYAAGADAYIIKNATASELTDGLLFIYRGEKNHMQEKVAKALENSADYPISCNSINIPKLTVREKEVLRLITEEKTTVQIAEELFLSDKTIESHRSKLFMKLEVKNSVGAVRKALEWGLLD